MKAILPWLCAAVLLGAALFLYSSNQRLAQQVAELREQSSQAQALQEEVETLRTIGSPAQTERIAQLERDNREVLRLRNEVRQLREDKQVLGRQAQTAEARAQAAQAQAQTAQAQVQEAQAQAMAAARPRATSGQPLDACINNLRQLDAAKQQWALENKKTEKDTPTEAELRPYFLRSEIPKCPAGGVYSPNTVETAPTCSVPGHQL
jgi:hypothetical protein